MKFLSLDFEGTHRDPRKGHPCEIGLAIMDDANVIYATYRQLIQPPLHWKNSKPMKEVDAYALRVSGLSLEEIENGLKSYEACKEIEAFVKENAAENLPVLAFNFSYDNECYRQLLYEGGWYDRDLGQRIVYGEIFSHKWICASSLARRVLRDDLSYFDLDSVAGYFGKERIGDVHGALEDAILAGQVFSFLTAKDKEDQQK